jgi:hypothetical protein
MTKLLLRSFSGIQVNNDKTNAKLLTIQRKKHAYKLQHKYMMTQEDLTPKKL